MCTWNKRAFISAKLDSETIVYPEIQLEYILSELGLFLSDAIFEIWYLDLV